MPVQSSKTEHKFAPVILAGGSGTRFWPRSRKTRAKQVLALDGERTMIQQTVDRLASVSSPTDVWVITNSFLKDVIAEQLGEVPEDHIVNEPAARNTAPACALAAFLLEKSEPETVIGIFPSDHVVKNTARFAEVIHAGIAIAASGDKIVVLGVPPTRAETGYGYIELGETIESSPSPKVAVRRVTRFTEKPHSTLAEQFVRSGNYAWNGGIFLWSARTLANAVREHCSDMASILEQIAAARQISREEFDRAFAELYPRCENISIDYAVLEPRSAKGEQSEIYCLPGDFDWNDLGCWSALHEHAAGCPPESVSVANVFDGEDPLCISIDSTGNYVHAPGKVIALVGVSNLVVVQTRDALLITTRDRSQDVGKVVAELKAAGREDLI
jgi:mannose-1-phosphate guanylyltransferase